MKSCIDCGKKLEEDREIDEMYRRVKNISCPKCGIRVKIINYDKSEISIQAWLEGKDK